MKTLNQMPVLDAGSVAIHSVSLTQTDILELKRDMFRGHSDDRILKFCNVIMYIKCPIFMQTYLSNNLDNIRMIVKKNSTFSAWKPDVTYIKAKELELSEQISKDIGATIDALAMNSEAYRMDGCDNFVSQVTTPISVYNELIVGTTLFDWIQFCHKTNVPQPIKQYRETIVAFLKAEYPHCKEVQELK